MFDANYTAREVAYSALEHEFPAILAVVATERGITVTAPKVIFRVRDDVRAKRVYPNAEVKPPEVLSLDDRSSGGVRSVVSLWVIGTLAGADPEKLDDEAQAYHTALVRTFLGLEGSVGGATFSATVRESSTSPPGKATNTLLQAAGARVEITIAEAR